MNSPKRIFRILLQSVGWIDLTLLILNSGIGLAIIQKLGYLINWTRSVFFIIWIISFYLGNEFLGCYLKQDIFEKDHTLQRYLRSAIQLSIVLFFSMSVIPLIQILLISFENYLVVYLICFLGFWLLSKNIFVSGHKIFGIGETVSSFVISFITPMIVLNLNGIRIHEILLPISFFSFIEIIVHKFLHEICAIYEGSKKGFTSMYMGYFSILKIITFLIPFGYISCLFLLFLQNRDQLIRPVLFTIPFAAFFVFKISQISGNEAEKMKTINSLSLYFVLLVEISWIIGLWIS